jgi:hypothetical protein
VWTLVLVIFLVSGTSNGGVATATSFLDFPNEAKCRAAADRMAITQQLTLLPPGPRPPMSPPATYRISAQCVER